MFYYIVINTSHYLISHLYLTVSWAEWGEGGQKVEAITVILYFMLTLYYK